MTPDARVAATKPTGVMPNADDIRACPNCGHAAAHEHNGRPLGERTYCCGRCGHAFADGLGGRCRECDTPIPIEHESCTPCARAW